MNKLTEKAAALLQEGRTSLIIGYEEGTNKPRPLFCKQTGDTDKLIFDNRCTHNLAVYLTRQELIGKGKTAVIANLGTLKSIARLTIEQQIQAESLIVMVSTDNGDVIELAGTTEINQYLQKIQAATALKDEPLINELNGMSRGQRWSFWEKELSRCFRCYACRAACPLCYCTRCIVEVNTPQWIQPWAAPLANMEWQINRAMHLTGRCTGCGACRDACPMDIPIHLLTRRINEDITREFGGQGETANVLSTFKITDKENFIQ